MTRIDHELLLSKIQEAERKYKSVAKAPPDVLAVIQQIAQADRTVTTGTVCLTEYERKILQWVIDGEMTANAATVFIKHSRTWINLRISAIKNDNYFILEDETNDEATKAHEKVSTQKKGSADAATRP